MSNSTDEIRPLDYAASDVPIEPDNSANLKGRTVSGSAWTLGGYIAGNAIRFITNLLLVRLVTQADFGTAAALATILQGLNMFSDVGIGPLVVQNPRGTTEPFLRTAFTLQVGRGVALVVAGCLLAWPLAWFYNLPELKWLVPIVSSGALFEGLRSTAFYRLNRNMQFRALVMLEIAKMVFGSAVMLVWAYLSPGVMALVVPPVIAIGLEAAVSHLLLPDRRDRFGWFEEAASEAINFGGWIFLSTALLFFANSADKLVFLKLYSAEDVAVYQIAYVLATLPTMALLKVGQSVVFPAYANVAQSLDLTQRWITGEGAERFRNVFLRVRLVLLLGGGFAVTGLLSAGPAMIDALYPESYAASRWILQLLAAGVWFQILEVSVGSAMLALGQPRWIALATGSKVLAMLVLIPILHLQFGFAGSVTAMAVAEGFRYLASAIAAKRLPVPLRLMRYDVLLTLGVAAASALAWLAGWSVSSYGPIAAFFAAAVTTVVLWAPVGVWWKLNRG